MRALTSTPGLRAHRRGRRALSAALSFVAVWLAPQTVVWLMVPAAASADETVMVCDIYGNHVAPQPRDTHGIHTTSRCPGNPARAHYSPARPPGGMAIWTLRHQTVKRGRGVHWTLTAPPGLRIASVDIPHMYSHGLDDGGGWGGALYWSGGSGSVRTFDGESSWSSANSGGARFEWPSRGTRYFGWRVRCRARRCTKGGDRWLTMELLELHVHETTRPHLIAPDGLWRAKGWIRGTWTLHLLGDSPSGLCATGSAINGEPGPGSIVKHNPAVWHQCDAPPVDQAVDTAQYGQGALPLTITTIDGAGASVSRTRTIHVDNQRPTVSLSGPRDASSSEGTQYVHATATAGPSGVKGIVCSLDHAPALWYPSPRAAVAVRGVGIHHLFCFSVNRARDAAGLPRTSVRADWTLSIRAPSVSTVSFVKVKGALRCHRQRERVRIPAHWVTAYHHGHPVRVKLRAQTRRIRVVRCHPRVVQRRVWRHGHWVRRRIVLLPHRVSVRHLQVHFGHGASISGWVGTADGVALGGQPVRILTAPDNGSLQFRRIRVVRTASDGTWRARLHPGPSRLVEAVYGGGDRAEPSVSRPARLLVSSGIRLHIHPRHTHWGRTVRIRGSVRGGYVPRAGAIILLWVGWKGGSQEIGYLYTRRDGRFSSVYTFRRGTGTQTYRLWAATGRVSDYPYTPARSNRVSVSVSP